MRKHRRLVLGAGTLALALFAVACGSGGDGDEGAGDGATAANRGEVTVGVSGAFAENQLVAEMYAQVLENAGYTVSRELDIAARDVSDTALLNGKIDLKPEYTGYELPSFDKKAATNGAPEEVAQSLADAVAAEGLVTYAISPANSTNVFVTTPEKAQQYNLTDMSSLAPVADQLVLGAPPECPKQDFCLPGLRKTYGIEFAEFRPLDIGGPKTVAAVKSGAVDVGELFSLDPNIASNGFTVLTDDKNLQAAGNFVPLVRQEVASEELGQLLDGVTTKLTDENMRDMVGQVLNEKRDVADVASEFLTSQGLA
jgi:osmoprotectant transport system substrate-binding protein